MAVNISRSLNGELGEGMTDGAHKKVKRDRASAEITFYQQRQNLNDTWYGIHEAPVKMAPDGSIQHTPSFVPTPAAHLP